MAGFYEAKVQTDFGTYRAVLLDRETIGIFEDGVSDAVDTFEIASDVPVISSPEGLLQTLVEWTYEFRRGEQLLRASVGQRL